MAIRMAGPGFTLPDLGRTQFGYADQAPPTAKPHPEHDLSWCRLEHRERDVEAPQADHASIRALGQAHLFPDYDVIEYDGVEYDLSRTLLSSSSRC